MRVLDIITYAVQHAGMGEDGAISTATYAFALKALNVAYENVWQQHTWADAKEIGLVVTTSDGVLVFPEYVDTIQTIYTGTEWLGPIADERWLRLDPSLVTTLGNPALFTMLRDWPVASQPSSAGAVTLASDSASDTSVVRVEGTVAGKRDAEEITLTGTTPVAGSKSFSELVAITKPRTVGRVSVSMGGSEIGSIAPWDIQPRYRRVQLLPIVDAEKTLYARCKRRFEALTSDYDSILLEKAESAILAMLVAELKRYIERPDEAAQWEQLAAARLKTAYDNETQQDAVEFAVIPEYGMFGGGQY